MKSLKRKLTDALDKELAATTFGPLTPKRQILEKAIETIADRGVPYGGVEDNFGRIALHWNAHLVNRGILPAGSAPLTPADVAMMMVLMKVARLENLAAHPDSWIDIAGYAACGGEITS